jgi:hypothetical protein
MEISSTNPVKVQSAPRPAAAAAPSATQASPAAAPATPAASVELQGRDLSQASDPKADPAVYTAAPVAAQQASAVKSDAQPGDAQPGDAQGDPAPAQDARVSDGPAGDAKAAEAKPAPSSLKSFGYGALGVSAPKGQPASNEDAYSAGQWTGAVLKVGGIIALLA